MTAAAAKTPPPPAAERPVSLLFVDDEPAILRAIVRSLDGGHYEVLTAGSPGEALGVLESRGVDVLISDVDMPEMDGIELVQIARRDHPATLRMLLTGAGTLEKALSAINEGEVLRFFNKPFDADLFLETMEAMAERIEKLRSDGESDHRKHRREELVTWLATRFPGAATIDKNDDGEIRIDITRLTDEIDAAGNLAAKELIRREG